jgi:signal transduction histidine kinase
MPSIDTSEEAFARVLRTDELWARTKREPDHRRESRAIGAVIKVLAGDPRGFPDALVAAARVLCNAGTAGLSTLDSETGGDPNLFRWRALAGEWASNYLGTTVPKHYSPCSVVFDRNSPQLLTDPASYFEYIGAMEPACREVLSVPLRLESGPIGTVWAVMHEPGRHFDAEDVRLLTLLAEFASAGYRLLGAMRHAPTAGHASSDELRALAQTNQNKDEFIATIAHELRNALGPIRNASAILKLASGDPPTVVRTSEVLERQSSAMARLIEDLLDVSRVRLGVLEMHPIELNVADVLRAALEASPLSGNAPSRRIDLQVAEEPLNMVGDPLRLTQIFGNLLTNAVKYTDPDGSVSIRLERNGQQIVVSISDDGIGIPAENIETIFDMFAQAGQAGTARSAGGLGVGLHLAKQLVESHKGQLTAASEGVGRGSTFTVRLPGS